MPSVTQRISQIKQPHGGYLNPNDFQIINNNDNEELLEENIHSSLVGLAVDYLTRVMLNTPAIDAFKISLLGATIIGERKKAERLLKNIRGIDSKSIYNACKIVGYDVCYRAGPTGYRNVDSINANKATINNIRIMVKRSITFFDNYGPMVKDGFTFEGGYTKLINKGDGDFLTKDTLWDFKVSSRKPKSAHTLQLLVYYIMGMHSVHPEFKNIKKVGIFNPRMNIVYLKNINEIPKETIDKISEEVIGYGNGNVSNEKILIATDIKRNSKYYSKKNKFEKVSLIVYFLILVIVCIDILLLLLYFMRSF